MEGGKYQLSLNYEGKEVLVEVDDLETATNLLNDPIAAQQCILQLIEQSKVTPDQSKLAIAEKDHTSGAQVLAESRAEQSVIWSTKRTTKSDQEATILLLEVRKKLTKQFADKTTRKAKLWADIAKTIIENGYNLGDTPAEKCRQKFSNLQKAYTKYINNQKTTGSEKVEIPQFFEEINEILGEQHKVNPVSLIDTEEDIPSTPLSPNMNSQPSTSRATPNEKQTTPLNSQSEIENRFSKKKHVNKYSKTNDLIREIQEDRVKRSEQFEFFKNHLKTTELQRDRLISILEKSVSGSKKRKRGASSSDSE